MNRKQLQELALIRLKEAKALLDSHNYNGAYYLSGYVVECALKACIAKKTKRHDFPDKTIVTNSYTHKLFNLVRTAGLGLQLEDLLKADKNFEVLWKTTIDWNEESRYDRFTKKEASDLYSAVSDGTHGVLEWLKHYW